jgi:hypothetical protein
MAITSLILGILSVSGVCVSFVPLLNLLNCITLPVALLGAIFGVVDLLRKRGSDQPKGVAIAGLVLCGLALLIGGARFTISLLTTYGIV